MSSERSELCGEILGGKFRIIRRIGLGGTGVVFEATSISDGSIVAVKMLRAEFATNLDLGMRLLREAEVSRKVRHPGVIPVLAHGTLSDSSPFIVMRRMYGESLSRLLLRYKGLPSPCVAALTIRIASILHSVHCAGYTHRDIKPEHILLNRSTTGDLLVYLLDFGICASSHMSQQDRQRELGKVFGTPTYVSPEQAAGKIDVDGRADLFALGIVLFETITGGLPFSGSTVPKLLLRIMRQDAPRIRSLIPTIEPDFDDIVARLLSRSPENRPSSARALSRLLLPIARDRYRSERNIASLLQITSHITDMAPTIRCRIPVSNIRAA